MDSFKNYTSIFVLLLTFNSAFGLTCYRCNSDDSKRCLAGFSAFTFKTVDCQGTGTANASCYRVTEVNKEEGTLKLARGCATPAMNDCTTYATDAGWTTFNVNNLFCDTCNAEKCNSGIMVRGVTITSIILAAVVFLI